MNFAWKFMMPMAFTCIMAAAAWHYSRTAAPGGSRRSEFCWWFISRSPGFSGPEKFVAPRTYRFAE